MLSKGYFPALKWNWFKFAISVLVSPYLFKCDYINQPFYFKMGQCIITVVLNTFDVVVKSWHFTTLYLTNKQLGRLSSLHSTKISKVLSWINQNWCRDGFLLLARQNRVWQRLSSLQGAFMRYCFREWLPRICFVFDIQQTSAADERIRDNGTLHRLTSILPYLHFFCFTSP